MSAEVAPGVFRISSSGINAFLLVADEIVLIDAHLPKRLGRIRAVLDDTGRDVRDLDHIAITHTHVDHVGSLAAVVETSGADVYAPTGEADGIRKGKSAAVKPIGVGRVLLPLFYTFTPKRYDPVQVDHEVTDGDVVGTTGLRAVDTPGHTPGHVSFLWP